jgi:hypothetical protein
MEFDTEFIQFSSLGPSIYRLTENLNLLKFGLWLLSVRMEDSHVQTVFCDRLSEIAQFFPSQVHVRTVFTITPFCIQTEH